MGDQKTDKIKVVLRDLDMLLRKKLGDSLIVDTFTTSSLVTPGENYGSTMLKVDAVVRRDGPSSNPEELLLVAKMSPPTEFQKEMFDSSFTFPKEIYMFEEIIPAYKALERECGVPETDVFDPLPEFFGARLSLAEADAKFDENAAILMENLKARNYTCGDRMTGADLVHTKLLIVALARFHALGIAVKMKKPALFEEFKVHATSMRFKDDLVNGIAETIVDDLKKCSALLPHIATIEAKLLHADSNAWIKPPEEPWGSIVHTDLWINNIMFRHDAIGNPVHVKFVDFQNYIYVNPLRDLVFFILSSSEKEVRDVHMDDLVDLYYETFVGHLTKLKCDVSSFSRSTFNEQIKSAANGEYMHCLIMAKVLTADPKTDPTAGDAAQIFASRFTDNCHNRMVDITTTYLAKKWL